MLIYVTGHICFLEAIACINTNEVNFMFKKTTKGNNPFSLYSYVKANIFSGVIAFVIGEFLFDRLTENLYTPLGVMLYFLLFGCILFVTLMVLLSKKLSAKEFNLKLRALWKPFLVVLFIFLLTTTVFEFLYELGKEEIPEPTSLIFLIDDSGSMKGNEADRVKALNDVMKNSNLPFAVYSFADNAKLLRNMEVYQTDITEENLNFASNGGTNIIPSINRVLEDLDNGVINNTGQRPKILLVSDGASSLLGLRSTAKKCKSRMVSISSIGMQGSSESPLKRIAASTGGVYVSCNDVTMLGDDLTQAIASDESRNLLSKRIIFKNDGIYAILRILFLSLMGVLWSFLKMMMLSETKELCRKMFVCSLVFCIIGTCIIEVGFANEISATLLRLIFVVMWAITIGTLPLKNNVADFNSDGIPDPAVTPDGMIKLNNVTQTTHGVEELKQIGGDALFKKDENSGNDSNLFLKNDGLFGNNCVQNQRGNGIFNNTQNGNKLFGNENNGEDGGIF